MPDNPFLHRMEVNMKKMMFAALMSLSSLTAVAWAQGTSSGISESTDPAKAAEVERKAQEMQARAQQQEEMSKKSSGSKQHAAKQGKGATSTGTSGATGSKGSESK